MSVASGFARKSRLRKIRAGEMLLVLVAAAATVAAFFVVLRPQTAATPQGTTTGTGVTETRWGPLDATDRVVLEKVRLAGLWEMPAGQMAQQRAGSAKVKEVGLKIMQQHMQLDADVRNTAQQLGVVLPAQPNADQQAWLKEMSGKTGADFDRTFVLRLRTAHGKVFPAIAADRSQTKNTVMRDFTVRAMAFVQNHMTLLESTGLVSDASLKSS